MRVLALAAAAVMALTACGDDDDALSEQEFREQGNAICDEGDETGDALVAELEAEPTDEQVEDFPEQVADILEGEVEDLRDLEPPDELAEDADAAIDELQDVVDEIREQGDAFFDDENAFAEVHGQFTAIGLSSCPG